MGFILDVPSAKLYEAWRRSDQGRDLDGLMKACMRDMLDLQPGERVLDIGCGIGEHLLFLIDLGMLTAGVDASPYMIQRARDRLGARADLRVGRAEELPFEDNEFDLAVMANTLEFLDHPLEALKEAGRVARRGVFIGVLNSLSRHCLCAKIKGLFRESFFNHVRCYNLWEMKSLVHMAYGDSPTVWRCMPMRPGLIQRIGRPLGAPWAVRHWPFGVLLGLSVSLRPLLRTEQHPLKIGLSKAGQPVANGFTRTFGSDSLPSFPSEGHSDERGLSV